MPTPISIVEASRKIRAGTMTPLEVLEGCLGQIGRHEDTVHAWAWLDEAGAREAAAERTGEAINGRWRGPLHGIPIGIKDIIDVRGLPTGAGSPLCGDQPAAADAPLVAALRRTGAVIVGKTVTVEFACYDPSPTRNPWNLDHTPGGSSSGSAAAVAMGMCLGALGTQTGGSLVRPSSYCGVAACKPTFGRLSTEGIIPVSKSLDHAGPIARTAPDLALLLDCLLDRKPQPTWPAAPPRLGVLEAFIDDADPNVQEATRAALRRLAHAGAALEPLAVPVMFREAMTNHRRIMAVEAATYHRERFAGHREQYGPLVAALLDEGLATPARDYRAAMDWHRAFRQQAAGLLNGFDALVMPSTNTTAPPTLATTGSPVFQAPWSLARLPVVSLPCSVADNGMPCAIQLIGPSDEESQLFRAAVWCEQVLQFNALPALWVM